ncbi:hypothetical protein DFJ68_1631 [Terracoccus luteus]|uniref:Uncharacterized protein n=1 Tax=Terracoccus luteus TaxID=53356 RepID=A0A495XUG4_9MICO|nr:DUF6584 family protein [Terracoccus luteus]RKT78191.1 hypothetical protein DFJ68_1631 [Terracoccus luteus]
MTDQLARARHDLASGRAWKARDRLHGLLCVRQDDEVLDLLATVLHGMGDLPAAGALWFVTGRDDDRARHSLAAWEERHGDAEARWRSIPASVRHVDRSESLRALDREARSLARSRRRGQGHEGEPPARWQEVLGATGCAVVGLGLLVVFAVGVVVSWRWVWS